MTDSAKILDELVKGTAALAPLGGVGEEMAGYKGYGYAAVVEILSAALSDACFMKDITNKAPDGSKQPIHLGHFFIVINPDFFMGGDVFRKKCGDICRGLRASKKAPGEERIYTAGEKEWDVWKIRKDKGVPIGEGVQKDFITVRDMYNLPYTFPFEK
jgi:LDH2 family malate/lactate/ureidoglycolate dehydrogenase